MVRKKFRIMATMMVNEDEWGGRAWSADNYLWLMMTTRGRLLRTTSPPPPGCLFLSFFPLLSGIFTFITFFPLFCLVFLLFLHFSLFCLVVLLFLPCFPILPVSFTFLTFFFYFWLDFLLFLHFILSSSFCYVNDKRWWQGDVLTSLSLYVFSSK